MITGMDVDEDSIFIVRRHEAESFSVYLLDLKRAIRVITFLRRKII